jgi:hypothetical protein
VALARTLWELIANRLHPLPGDSVVQLRIDQTRFSPPPELRILNLAQGLKIAARRGA